MRVEADTQSESGSAIMTILSNPKKTHLPHILTPIKETEEKEVTKKMPVVTVETSPGKKTGEGRISEYENLIVAHYLEELRKAPPYTKKSHRDPVSPYAQKLPHTNIVLTAAQVKALMEKQRDQERSLSLRKPRSRPASAMTYSQAQKDPRETPYHDHYPPPHHYSPPKPKIDPKFIADPSKWDPATPRPEEPRRRRPQSAPMGRDQGRRRPISAYKGYQRTGRPTSAQRPSSAKSTSSKASSSRRARPLHQQQPHTIVVTAYKNGSRDNCCKVAAPNIKLLLEMCTEKLGLPLAGRRVFTCSGDEVRDGHEVERGSEVFISMGEDFKDPDASAKLHTTLTRGVTWRMNGLVLPEQGRKKTTKPVLSKRFKQSIERKTIRVLVYKNGKHTDGVEVVADPKQWPLALDKMGGKLDLRAPVRVLYDSTGRAVVSLDQKWDGNDVITADDVPVLDACLQPVTTGLLYGPLWASSGEGFNPGGAQAYIHDLINQIRVRVRDQGAYIQQVKTSRDGSNDHVTNVAIMSMTEDEKDETINNLEAEIAEFQTCRKKLEAQLEEIEPLLDQQRTMSNSYTLQHIKEIDSSDRLVGIRGINLLVYKNGTDMHPYKVFFNLTDAGKRSNSKDEVMQKLLDHIAANCHQLREEGSVKGLVSRKWKLYNASGREIQEVDELLPVEQTTDEEVEREVWLSFGEPYKSPFTLCLQATFDKVIGLSVIKTSKPASTIPKQPKIVPPSMKKSKKQKEKKKKEEKVHMFGEVDDSSSDSSDDDFDYSDDSDAGDEDSSEEEARAETPIIMEEKTVAMREPLDIEDVAGRERSSFWRATTGFPENYTLHRVDMTSPDAMMGRENELDPQNLHFLQSKSDGHLLLYPELSLGCKRPRASKDLWPSESQIWAVTQDGTIHMKAFPQLVLTVTETFVKMELPSVTLVEGYEVALRKRYYGASNQSWKFGSDGLIRCESHPELALTYLGGVFDNPDSVKRNDGDELPPGHRFFLSVCEQLPRKDAKYQRFAIKQERFDNLGQWKHSTVENPEWNKLAYSWPTDRNGEWNEKFDWPMEGSIIALAPPIHNPRKTTASAAMRLAVLRNGEKDSAHPQLIVGPDLSNMQKDLGSKTRSHGRGHQHDAAHEHGDSVSNGQHLHCSDMSLNNLEFMLFLEHCTNALSLPFAARRLYDSTGREHFTLRELERDALVYVSCGEPWSDPKLSKAEQQRRFLLANLAADIAQIRQFVALRDPADLVLEIEGGLTPNTRLVVNKNALSSDEVSANQNEAVDDVTMDADEAERKQQLEEMLAHNTTSAHERSHATSAKRMETLKWPWERLVSGSMDADLDQPAEMTADPTQAAKRQQMRMKPVSPRYPRYHLQKFSYGDGYLSAEDRPDLVLGVAESEGRLQEILVMKKRPDDIFQRWIIDSTGLIRAKHNPKMVMTVSIPSNMRSGEESLTLSYANSPVMLSQVKNTQFGRANQKFYFDQETGLIHAFYTDFLDKEITAANKVNICTHAVIGETELDQPGYEVDYPVAKREVDKVIVCASCARAMRGRFKTQKISKNVDFACAMGTATEKGIKQVGSFQCLNGKVDLSSYEAQHTLDMWEEQFQRLRKKRSVRAIAKEIATAECPRTVKAVIYKNGEGRARKGEVIYGSSVNGLLTQATTRVRGLSFAARRLYTCDGTIVMDIDDLVTWAVDEYMIQAKLAKLRKQQPLQTPLDSGDATAAAEKEAPEVPPSDSTVGSGPVEVRKLMKSPLSPKYHEEEGDTDDSHRFLEDQPADQVDQEKAEATDDAEEQEDDEEAEEDEEEYLTEHQRQLAELADVEVKMPALDEILRHPIELWASCGEKFKKPEAVSDRLDRKRRERSERADISRDLETEKHKLRHMQGRRLDEMYPGDFISTNDPDRPVVIEGTWQEPTPREQDQHDTVHQLQSHLLEVRATQKTDSLKTCNAATSRRLYTQPKMKRVLVYANGESVSGAVYVWGESHQQLLDNATLRLNLRRRAKFFFTVDAQLIPDFESIERDQILCAAAVRKFMQPRDVRETVEIKANWGRARKKYGPRATDIEVMTLPNPRVDVDPFGPPLLATPSSRARPQSAKPASTTDGTEFIDDMDDQ